ncbi:MAG: 2-hydroxyacyl-CoA dehydratase family protein [Acidobacteriota bacterium]
MMQAYLEDLERALKQKLEEKPTARRRFVYEIGRLGTRLFDGRWSVAWTTVFVPFEILHSMGVAGNFIEFVGAMLAGTGAGSPFLERAEAAGYSTDSCSYHRAILGAAMERLIPDPRVLIGASFPCDGGIKALKRIGELHHKDVFLLHIPFESTPEAVDYLADQYRRMAEHITAATGKTLDLDILRETIRRSNQAREYLVEALDFCKRVPCPADAHDLKNFIVFVLLLGTPEGVEVARMYRDQFKDLAERGGGGMAGERHRLLWIQNRIQFKNDLIRMLEEEFGANIVIDELNHVYWEPMDEADPLRGLARRMITHPLLGPIDRRLETLSMLAREYHVDGAINPAHWGCRQSGGARHMFKEALQKVGVPLLHLDVDCVDERNYSEGQVRTRLEAFMEMLGDGK